MSHDGHTIDIGVPTVHQPEPELDRNTYRGTWDSLVFAGEAVAKLGALGYTDVTLTSVALPGRTLPEFQPQRWEYQVEAVQRTPADALKEDSERRRAS